MNLTHFNPPRGRLAHGLAVCLFLGASLAHAQQIYRPAATPGGINPQPAITAVTRQGTNTTVKWTGLMGKYHVQTASQLGAWSDAGTPTAYSFDNALTFPTLPGDTGFFRLIREGVGYVGVSDCGSCHGDVYSAWLKTGHATAYSSIANLPPATRKNCLVCHTIGYGQPTGFVSVETTPHLANVGCENCHGPAMVHQNQDHYGINKPVVTIAAEVCGGCHDGEHHPTYEEWSETPHAVVTPDVALGASGMTNIVNGPGRQMSCGACHSGATRMAMIGNYEDMMAGYTNALVLPTGTDAAAMGVTCVVCHDPHATNGGPAQLRYPVFSTNFFAYTSGSVIVTNKSTNWNGTITTNLSYLNTYFNTQYNASIQVCGQCHNTRGAKWTDTSRPPHHSPQYNMLIGIVQPGYLTVDSKGATTNYLHRPHAVRNPSQCAQCHVHGNTNTMATGHTFEVAYTGCQEAVGGSCHSSLSDSALSNKVYTTQFGITTNLQAAVALLSQWSLQKAPTLLGTSKYAENAWEFATKGVLGVATNAGPSAADQAKLPDNIKKARFNLYLVQHDASFGVHNPSYTRFLINDAKTNVLVELNKP